MLIYNNADYDNADFDSMRKIFNNEFNVTVKNFTNVNDQLSYVVKTLNIAEEPFIPRKNVLLTIGIILNQIKLQSRN